MLNKIVKHRMSWLLLVGALLAGGFGWATLKKPAQAAAALPVAVAPPTPPRFSIDFVAVNAPGLPGLHSFALAQANGKFLLFGGRTNGLHQFVTSTDGGTTPPPNAFPPDKTNRQAWVIDPAAQRVWSAPLQGMQGLSAAIADQLMATNTQHIQDGDTLFVLGGYGLDSQTQTMVTFPGLLAIQVSNAINAVINNQSPAPFIQQTTNYFDCPDAANNLYNQCVGPALGNCTATSVCPCGPNWATCVKQKQAACRAQRAAANAACINCVKNGNTQQCTFKYQGQTVSLPIPVNTGSYAKVTGGGLEKVGDVFYLVFGQDFEGLYSLLEGDYGKWPISQVYSEQIVALQITANPLAAALLRIVKQDPSDTTRQFHRRDLNVEPALTPAGAPRLGIYGGVFVPGQDAAYRHPIYIDGGANAATFQVKVDKRYQQMMSQYDCATLTLFDRVSPTAGNMLNVFFGGISLYYLDRYKTFRLRLDEGIPFSQDLSVMTRYPDGSYSEYVRRTALPCFQNRFCYVGADAEFIPNLTLSAASNGVIYLDAIKERTRVGYLFGGMASTMREVPPPQISTDTTAANALYEVWLTPTPPPATYWIQAAPRPAPSPAPGR